MNRTAYKWRRPNVTERDALQHCEALGCW